MKYVLIFIFFGVIGISRFYNITWGAPYFFHPDERNIASSITQLSLPSQMNPHFFAYGSIPLYSIYFLGVLANITSHSLSPLTVSFEHAIIIGRFFSAAFSILLIILMYKMAQLLFSRHAGIFAAILGVTSIGFIQYAHFATFEMWLTYFSFLLTYFCILYSKTSKKIMLFYITTILALLIGTKISSIVLFFPVFLSVFLRSQKVHTKKRFFFLKSLLICITITLVSVLLYFFTNPFVLLDTNSFLDSMHYESSVGLGTLPVFYTQGFLHTLPILYQFLHVFPFILTPFLTIFFIPCFLYFCFLAYKQKNKSFIIFISFFLTLFFSQALLFVKWTRYLIPTLPYIYTLIAFVLFTLFAFYNAQTIKRKMVRSFIIFLLFFSSLYAVFFVYEVYHVKDTRLDAYTFAKESLPKNASILSEVYDLGIVPFNQSFLNITLINFYDLESNPTLASELDKQLSTTEYIILPSQRVVKNRLLSPSLFPQGNKFYRNLFNSKKYQKIYETPCDFFCKLIYNGDPVFNLEETATVFDRPTVYIFKKI